jgi:hypothetical protein
MPDETTPATPNSSDTLDTDTTRDETGIVIVNDERVGGTGAIIGEVTSLTITYQTWQEGDPVPEGALLMTQQVAEMSGYVPQS